MGHQEPWRNHPWNHLSLLFFSGRSSWLNKLFLRYCWPTKRGEPYLLKEPFLEVLFIANLQHAIKRIWTFTESEFILFWRKLWGTDNYYTVLAPERSNIFLMFLGTTSQLTRIQPSWTTFNTQLRSPLNTPRKRYPSLAWRLTE